MSAMGRKQTFSEHHLKPRQSGEEQEGHGEECRAPQQNTLTPGHLLTVAESYLQTYQVHVRNGWKANMDV